MNVPGTFVRIIEVLFHDQVGKTIWVYIDNIFVFSHTFEKYVKDMTHACSKLQNGRYYSKQKKRVSFATKLDILGQMIDHDRICPAPEKLWTIMD